MELQFQNKPLHCMRQVAWDTKNEEQTLEIRVTEDMPPVDKILAAWGQPIIRSKEWNADQVLVSGGVLAWVLYDAQNGTGPQKVEGWIPFQFKWDLEASERDGVFHTQWLLRSVDARLTGAGKLMVRASVSVLGEGMEETTHELYMPNELPADVQVHKSKYELCIPVEAGEKVLQLDEEMVIPPGQGEIDRVLAYLLRPVVTEKKLMADKFVFRGVGKLQVIYMCTDGRIHTYDTDIPISQYTQLEREYGPDAYLRIIPEISEMEVEKTDPTRLRLKASVVGQYSVWETQTMEVVTDAYSNRRSVERQMAKISLPHMIEEETLEGSGRCNIPVADTDPVACVMWMGHPCVKHSEGGDVAAVEGLGQLLFYDGDGNLCAESRPWEAEIGSFDGKDPQMVMWADGHSVFEPSEEGGVLKQNLLLSAADVRSEDVDMVVGLTLGDMEKPDPSRPSLVLCTAGDKSLWELAKSCGSTVSAICKANGLDGEPDSNKMLIVPVE